MADRDGRSREGCDSANEEHLTDAEVRLRARTAIALYVVAGVAIGGAVAVDGCFAVLALEGGAPRGVLRRRYWSLAKWRSRR
jgi:hypothetical protein